MCHLRRVEASARGARVFGGSEDAGASASLRSAVDAGRASSGQRRAASGRRSVAIQQGCRRGRWGGRGRCWARRSKKRGQCGWAEMVAGLTPMSQKRDMGAAGSVGEATGRAMSWRRRSWSSCSSRRSGQSCWRTVAMAAGSRLAGGFGEARGDVPRRLTARARRAAASSVEEGVGHGVDELVREDAEGRACRRRGRDGAGRRCRGGLRGGLRGPSPR